MTIYLAVTLFSLIIVIYVVITELFTILFRFTGLPADKARFQVISLLTGCGYTTHESELLMASKARRRLARYTMLFGYVFNITIISAFINVFFSLDLTKIVSNVLSFIIPIVVILTFVLFIRIPKIRKWGEDKLERIAARITHQGAKNSVLLIDQIGNDVIAQVTLREVPEAYRDVPLFETGIKKDHDILVMIVDRDKAEAAGANTIFRNGDRLTVFGNYKEICKIFEAGENFSEE